MDAFLAALILIIIILLGLCFIVLCSCTKRVDEIKELLIRMGARHQ